MSGLKLYEIDAMLQQAMDAARAATDPETGEMPESWAEFLDAVEMERSQKIINCVRVVKSLNGEAAAIKEEEDRLAYRRRTLENEVDRLKGYVVQHMQAGEKIADATVQISTCLSPSVYVDPLTELPAQYTRTKIEPDKPKIKDALINGETVLGCEIITKRILVIK